MSVTDLVNEQAALNDAIYQIKNEIIDEEIKERNYEAKLWIETDFKALKLSNKEMRDAYIKSEMSKFFSNVSKLKNDLELAKNELDLCKTKIKLALELGIDFDDSTKNEIAE